MTNCPGTYPHDWTAVDCSVCDRNRVARCRPGCLNRLRAAYLDGDDTAGGIYNDTLEAIQAQTHRVANRFLTATESELNRIALINQGIALLRIGRDHQAFPAPVFDAFLRLDVTLNSEGIDTAAANLQPLQAV